MSRPFHTVFAVIAGVMHFLAGAGKGRAADWKPMVSDFLQDKPHMGLVIGVVEKGKRKIQGFGKVSIRGAEMVPDENTLFEIGSITKAFTGTLMASLVEAGKVRPDDPVNKYLPDNLRVQMRDDRDVSLLHLATHTAGLPVQPPLLPLYALASGNPFDPYAAFDLEKLSKTIKAFKPSAPFGAKFEYSNLGVGILGIALAGANESPSYEEALSRRVLQPLGMADTVFKSPPEKLRKLALGHNKSGKANSGWTFGSLEACGGLRSCGRDMTHFLEAASGQRETALKSTFELAQRPWREASRKDQFVGFCWLRQKSPGGEGTLIWHNGGTGGYRSFLGFIPESNIGVVVLSNTAHSVDNLAISILRELEKAASEAGKTK